MPVTTQTACCVQLSTYQTPTRGTYSALSGSHMCEQSEHVTASLHDVKCASSWLKAGTGAEGDQHTEIVIPAL